MTSPPSGEGQGGEVQQISRVTGDTPGSLVGPASALRVTRGFDTFDARADGGQLARDVLVTPGHVPRVVQHALAFGAQRGDDQRGARADVRHGELRALEPAWTVHGRVQAALDPDARAHLRQLVHVLESVLVHVLGD